MIGALLLVAGAAYADSERGCAKPEWAQLHGADKDELRHEYCHMVREAKSNEWSHRNVQETIRQKAELQLDTMPDRERSLEYLRATTSCKVAAAHFQAALSRRFKSKPPASCD
jgi:hypothetical protein